MEAFRGRAFGRSPSSRLKRRGGTSNARNAATPIGALHNYALAVALGQVTRACIGAGLDPCIGFLHPPKPGRLSFAYDCLELYRAVLAEAVFGFAARQTFSSKDFEVDGRGVGRLGPWVAQEIATAALSTAPMVECVKTVRRIVSWF